MKIIYARQGLQNIIETVLNESYVRFVHHLTTDTMQEYYQTEANLLQVVIVSDGSLDDQAWYTVDSEIRNYFKLHFERFDFVKNVTVIYDDERESGLIKLGIDMVEYGGGDWDEPIIYQPHFTVIDSSNVSDDIIENVIKFVIDNCEVEDFGDDLEYETVIGER